MALLFAGSQFLDKGSALVAAPPLTLACWVKATDLAATRNVMDIGDATDANGFKVFPNSSTGLVQARSIQAGASQSAASLTGITAGNWCHICAVFTSTTSRASYMNGANKGTNAVASTPGALTTIRIGASSSGAGSFLGAIAFPAIWNIALADADVAALYNAGNGADPRNVQGANLISFLELAAAVSPQPDDKTTSWAVTGTPTFVADPFMLIPPAQAPAGSVHPVNLLSPGAVIVLF